MTLASDYLFRNHAALRRQFTRETDMHYQDNECIYCATTITMMCRRGEAFCSQRCQDGYLGKDA